MKYLECANCGEPVMPEFFDSGTYAHVNAVMEYSEMDGYTYYEEPGSAWCHDGKRLRLAEETT